jgi:molybdopterin/thiamine biosynthesis adenylyltransferase
VAEALAFRQSIIFEEASNEREFDSILNVGTKARSGLPWTVISCDGWLARITSGPRDLPVPSGQTNPIAAMAAAAMGVSETFKRLLGVRASRGELLEDAHWSLFSYATNSVDRGPPLPAELQVDLLLAGGGAIGNGIVHLLGRLPTRGRVLIIDPQDVAVENLGTCLLVGPADVSTPKVRLADQLQRPQLYARGYKETIEQFSRRLGRELSYPRTILGALDNISARHALQDLWPDVLVDGAIGPFSCQVSRHPIAGDVACARCLFRHPPGVRAELVASRATGLMRERVATPDSVVSQEDVDVAPPEKRAWLSMQLGKPICSVVSEAVTREVSDNARPGFEPSVPFVACLASGMVVAELVKTIMNVVPCIEPRFQFDVLRGPAHGAMLPL